MSNIEYKSKIEAIVKEAMELSKKEKEATRKREIELQNKIDDLQNKLKPPPLIRQTGFVSSKKPVEKKKVTWK